MNINRFRPSLRRMNISRIRPSLRRLNISRSRPSLRGGEADAAIQRLRSATTRLLRYARSDVRLLRCARNDDFRIEAPRIPPQLTFGIAVMAILAGGGA